MKINGGTNMKTEKETNSGMKLSLKAYMYQNGERDCKK